MQRWLGLVVPLPDEPVAVGARWRVVSMVRSGGVVLKQTATYRLTAADADGWTVELEAERIGEAQEILVPGVEGALGELVALRRLVKGTLTVAAADPLPLRGTLISEVLDPRPLPRSRRRLRELHRRHRDGRVGPVDARLAAR